MKRREGIVCVLDVLGYSSMMKNSDVGENIYKIIELMEDVPKKNLAEQKRIIKTSFEEGMDQEPHDLLQRVTDSIETLVFSDTILVTLEVPKLEDFNLAGGYWLGFSIYVNRIYLSFLENGLPLRGAISFGEYVIKGNCFAGKPIIDAFNTAENLNSSGILLDNLAYGEVLNIYANIPYIKDVLIVSSYKTPLKNGDTDAQFLSFGNLLTPKLIAKYGGSDSNLLIALTSAFTAHNKGLNEQAREKLDNTIEYFKMELKLADKRSQNDQ